MSFHMQSHHTSLEINNHKILVVFLRMGQNKGNRQIWDQYISKQLYRDLGLCKIRYSNRNIIFYTSF